MRNCGKQRTSVLGGPALRTQCSPLIPRERVRWASGTLSAAGHDLLQTSPLARPRPPGGQGGVAPLHPPQGGPPGPRFDLATGGAAVLYLQSSSLPPLSPGPRLGARLGVRRTSGLRPLLPESTAASPDPPASSMKVKPGVKGALPVRLLPVPRHRHQHHPLTRERLAKPPRATS